MQAVLLAHSLAMMISSTNVSLSGAVYDMSLNAIKGVKVSLQSSVNQISDTTNIDGTWQLNGTIVSASKRNKVKSFTLRDEALIIRSELGNSINVEYFNAKGAILDRQQKYATTELTRFEAGEFIWKPVFLRITENGTPIYEGPIGAINKDRTSSSIGARLLDVTNDSLVYSFNGWIRAKSPLGSYEATGIIQKIDIYSPSQDSINYLRANSKVIADSLNTIFITTHPESKRFIDSAGAAFDSIVDISTFAVGTEKSMTFSAYSFVGKSTLSLTNIRGNDSIQKLVDLLAVSDSVDSAATIASPSYWKYATIESLPNNTQIVSSTSDISMATTRSIIAYLFSIESPKPKAKIVSGQSYILKLQNGRYAHIMCNAISYNGPKNTTIQFRAAF